MQNINKMGFYKKNENKICVNKKIVIRLRFK